VKYAWIGQHAGQWPLLWMCRALGVSASGYYDAKRRAGQGRQAADRAVVARMADIQQRHRGCYGWRRMQYELGQGGAAVNHKRVKKLMRQHGLQSRIRRRYRVRTTDSNHRFPVAANLLERRFGAAAPDRTWVADLTYVHTGEGWLYCAFVKDLFAGKIVGWAMGQAISGHLTLAALRMALGLRLPSSGLMHHSDRGSQYAANDYRALLRARGIAVSMSRSGNCWDNAPMESFNGTLKVECIYQHRFATRDQARRAIVEYIGYYNTERAHSSLNYQTPAAFEHAWQARQRKEASPAA